MVELKPQTTLTAKITSGSAVLLAILAIVMSGGFVGQDDVYTCFSTEVAMKCDRLSAVNSNGIQTRCYYEDEIENRTRYKNCKTGWLPYVPVEEKIREINFTTLDKIYLLCEKKNNFTTLDRVYLLCESKNKFMRECQVLDSNETIIKISNT